MTTTYKKEHVFAHELYFFALKVSSFRLFFNLLKTFCFTVFSITHCKDSLSIRHFKIAINFRIFYITIEHFLKQSKVSLKNDSQTKTIFFKEFFLVKTLKLFIKQILNFSQLTEFQAQNCFLNLILHPEMSFKKLKKTY